MNRLGGDYLLTVPTKDLKQFYFIMGTISVNSYRLFNQMKEDYENVKQLLLKTNYAEFNLYVCGDFKMLGFLLGLQGGYTKY